MAHAPESLMGRYTRHEKWMKGLKEGHPVKVVSEPGLHLHEFAPGTTVLALNHFQGRLRSFTGKKLNGEFGACALSCMDIEPVVGWKIVDQPWLPDEPEEPKISDEPEEKCRRLRFRRKDDA